MNLLDVCWFCHLVNSCILFSSWGFHLFLFDLMWKDLVFFLFSTVWYNENENEMLLLLFVFCLCHVIILLTSYEIESDYCDDDLGHIRILSDSAKLCVGESFNGYGGYDTFSWLDFECVSVWEFLVLNIHKLLFYLK